MLCAIMISSSYVNIYFAVIFVHLLLQVYCEVIQKDHGDDIPEFLEYLAFKYGTDKSKDDHGYTNMYMNLFDHRRKNIFNMTEIGTF